MPEQFLHGVEIVEISDGVRAIQTVRSSVIGLIGSAPKGPVNTPVLIMGSRTDAVQQFGQGVGTIPDALDAIFDQAGAMVVVVNVLDPSTHKAEVSGEAQTFDDNDQLTPDAGYIANLVIKDETDTDTYVEDTDYTVANADTDEPVITRVDGGSITAGETVHLTYDRPDPTAVDASALVGGVDGATGDYEGVHVFLAAQGEVHATPRILCAPGYTGDRPEEAANPVVAEMLGIADSLRAVIIADGPNTTDAEAITYREDWGSKRVFVVDPQVKVWDTDSSAYTDMPASARVAGIIARTDANDGFWWSPSNKLVYGIGGTSRPVDFSMGDPNSRANWLNENEVATVINATGYRLWGNRTCSADPKWAFLSVVRTADMIHESLLAAHLWAVDRNITKTYLEDVTEGVNAYLRHLTAIGAILGGQCWADPELNTPTQIAAGKVYFDFDFTPPAPAEHVTFRSHLVNDYIEEIV